MDDKHRQQTYNKLQIKETEELLEIWESADTNQWNALIFEVIKQILVERLGYVPPQSIETQVSQILDLVDQHLDRKEYGNALHECDRAIQLDPDSPIAYQYRGEIYDQMGQPEKAITNYQIALQFDRDLNDVWENLHRVEGELEEKFNQSATKNLLDQAFDFAKRNQTKQALDLCESILPELPSIATAHNYLGLIYHALNRFEPAIESYLTAIRLNPRFYVARENLAQARLQWDAEQYEFFSQNRQDENLTTGMDYDDAEIIETDEPIPQWFYMDSKTYHLVGWAGYRTRMGRSGCDPLETDFEFSRMQGVVLHRLMKREFRTRNPIYLLFMAGIGVIYLLYGILPFTTGNLDGILTGILSSPYSIAGMALLTNVCLSFLHKPPDDHKENGYMFY